MPTLKKPANAYVTEARARIEEVETADLIAQLDDPDVVIVDIRDAAERARTGTIPGAVHAPRHMIEFFVDAENSLHKDIFSAPGKRYVFHCASGGRSALTVAQLNDWGFDAAHLREGFSGWQRDGGPVQAPE